MLSSAATMVHPLSNSPPSRGEKVIRLTPDSRIYFREQSVPCVTIL
jgi:hypothetical protein